VHQIQKRKRCIAEVRRLAPKVGVLKAFRRIADTEDVSHRTVQRWWYEHQKQLRQEEKSNTQVQQERRVSPSSVLLTKCGGSAPSETAPFKLSLPYLIASEGRYRCSRCGSGKHLKEMEDSGFFCTACRHQLSYEVGEDYQIKSVKPSGGPHSWMR
jgi:hypothetical protein